MAYHMLWKWFIRFRKIPYINYIHWYKQQLFNEWYKSLSDEDKQAYNNFKKRKKKRVEREVKSAWKELLNLHKIYGYIS